jgi:hypothetical protein
VSAGISPRGPDAGPLLLRLLCAVARADLREADRDAIRGCLADPSFDAESLLVALRRHGLEPLAYRHLIASDNEALPAGVVGRLSAAFRARETRQARVALRLCELLTSFEAAALDVLAYKGPLLGLQLYGDYRMRQYGDLDLLVRPTHASRVIALLLARGFNPLDGVEADGTVPLVRHRHACALGDPLTGIIVEVHWRLLDRLYGPELPIDSLMEHPQTLQFCGRPARTIGGERLLLALCLHGAAHQWERLAWLGDVAQLVRSTPDLDWTIVTDRARQIRFARGLGATLLLVGELFGDSPGGPSAADVLRAPDARKLAGRILARLSRPASARLSMAERFRLGWLGREGLIERATFGWRVATHVSPRDLGQSPLGRLAPVAVGRRAIRLFRTAVARR